MLKLKKIKNTINKEITKTQKEELLSEKKSKQIIYSQQRTPESILNASNHLLLTRKRLVALNKLKQSLSLIKESDENKVEIQNLLQEITVLLQNI